MKRRNLLTVLGSAGVISTAGCLDLDFLNGDDDHNPPPNETHTHEPELSGFEFDLDITPEIDGEDIIIETHNKLGRPVHHVAIEVNIKDENEDPLETNTYDVYGLKHTDKIRLVKPLLADEDIAEQIALVTAETSTTFGDPAIPANTPESCGDAPDWLCDGIVKVGDFSHDVNDEEGITTITGAIENISDEQAENYHATAQFIVDETIVATGIQTSDSLNPGPEQSEDFEIAVDQTEFDTITVTLSKPLD